MIFSKIKRILKDRLADELKGRLDYHMTTYANSSGFTGRAWLTWDGAELINFSNIESYLAFGGWSNASVGSQYYQHPALGEEGRTEGLLMEYGEFSKYDFGETAWQFIDLDIEAALHSENPLMRGLAAVDRRTGRKRLKTLQENEKHPFVQKMIALRVEAQAGRKKV